MTHARLSRVLVGLLAPCLVVPAAAQQRSLPELSWQAPAGCPQAQAVRERVAAIAGTGTQRETRLQAQGEITEEAGRFHLRLVMRDGELSGERNIVSDSCDDLAGAAAVALGLLLRSETPLTQSDLSGAAPGAGPSSPTEPARPQEAAQPQPVPAPRKEVSQSPAPEATQTRRFRALLRAPAVVAELGPLPSPSLGVGLGVGVGYETWSLLLLGELWLDQTVYGTALPEHGADVGRKSAVLRLGRGIGAGRWVLTPHVTLALEHLTARGVGSGVVPQDQSATWLAPGAGLTGALRLGKVAAIFAEVDGRYETARPLITIDGLGRVRQLAPVALASSLGAEWSF